ISKNITDWSVSYKRGRVWARKKGEGAEEQAGRLEGETRADSRHERRRPGRTGRTGRTGGIGAEASIEQWVPDWGGDDAGGGGRWWFNAGSFLLRTALRPRSPTHRGQSRDGGNLVLG